MILLPLVSAALLAAPPAQAPVRYLFEDVKRSVEHWPGGDRGKAVKAVAGMEARPGDVVRTGWWGRTVLAVPEAASRFEVQANTQVRLAGGEPGVLVTVERGALKALFQALLAGETRERQVAVPGALLAVRGTRYGVEVGRDGRTVLAVFEGTVEVRRTGDPAGATPVKAGEWSLFGPGLPMTVAPMGPRGYGEESWGKGMRPDGSRMALPMAPGMNMPGAMHPGTGPMGH